MASTPTTYKKGTQDMRPHQETYALFWGLTKWGVITTLIIMIGLAYFFT